MVSTTTAGRWGHAWSWSLPGDGAAFLPGGVNAEWFVFAAWVFVPFVDDVLAATAEAVLWQALVEARAACWPCPAAVAALGVAAVVDEAGVAVAFTAPGGTVSCFVFPLAVAGHVTCLPAFVAIDQFRFSIPCAFLWLLLER